MLLRITRKRDGAVLSIVRDDGGVDVSRSRQGAFFATHDLMHYAVESVMGFKRAFLGLLAEGARVRDFDDASSAVRAGMPPEAVFAEHIVGLLHGVWSVEGLDGLRGAGVAGDVGGELARAGALLGACAPEVSREQVDAIAALFGSMIARWEAVPVGGTLELAYPMPAET